MLQSRYNQERLIAAARRGDHEAFRALTQPWLRELRSQCARILGNGHDADDALQETLIKAWRKLDSYAATGPVRAWLHTIAVTTSLNLLKARRRDGAPADGIARDQAGPGADAQAELHERVEEAFLHTISALPPRQRAAIVLRDGLGWSSLEISQLLGLSIAAVNSALQRARAAIATAPSTDIELGALSRALLAAYVSAWDDEDIDRLATLARADAARTSLLERLQPIGGGWVRVDADAPVAHDRLAFLPAFQSR